MSARKERFERLSKALAPLRARWAALAPRERRGLLIAATVLGAYLLWAVAIAPAWRTLRSAPAERAALEIRLQLMRADASEARTLRAAPRIDPAQAQAALQAAARRLGDAGQLTPQGTQRSVLLLRGTTTEQLQAFVSEARSGAHARVIEAQLRSSSPGHWNGTLALGLADPLPAEAPR